MANSAAGSSPDKKRSKKDIDGDAVLVEEEVDTYAILESFRTELLGVVESNNKALQKTVLDTMADTMGKLDRATQRRLGQHDQALASLEERVVALERSAITCKSEMEKIGKELVVANSAKPKQVDLDSAEFEREIDSSIVRIRAELAVSIASLTEVVRPLLASMELDDGQWELEGGEPGRAFVLRFKGATGMASKRVAKFLMLQKQGKEWRELHAKTPLGVSSRIFLDVDKNKKADQARIAREKIDKVVACSCRGQGSLSQKVQWHYLL